VDSLPQGYYVKSIRMGDVDALKNGIDFTRQASGPLEILLNPNGGRLEGFVTNARLHPAASATVVLVPEMCGHRPCHYFKKAMTDQNGHFTINGVAPGEYKVLALDRIDDSGYKNPESLYQDPESLKPFADKGEAIAIPERGDTIVRLKLIH
jgi:hypothetical protein